MRLKEKKIISFNEAEIVGKEIIDLFKSILSLDENYLLALWVVADNVYGKGAALNAVQIAQTLLNTNKF